VRGGQEGTWCFTDVPHTHAYRKFFMMPRCRRLHMSSTEGRSACSTTYKRPRRQRCPVKRSQYAHGKAHSDLWQVSVAPLPFKLSKRFPILHNTPSSLFSRAHISVKNEGSESLSRHFTQNSPALRSQESVLLASCRFSSSVFTQETRCAKWDHNSANCKRELRRRSVGRRRSVWCGSFN